MRNANDQKPSVNVLELLAAQHAEVDALLEVIEKKRPDRREAFAILANKVAAHATVEEKIFYPAVMAKQTDELLHEAVEEHLEIKRCLADLLTMDPGDASFDAKISVLKEDLAHHAHEEEEGKLFPILRRTLTEDELGALGNECLAMFEQLMEGTPARNVPAETKEAAPLPEVA